MRGSGAVISGVAAMLILNDVAPFARGFSVTPRTVTPATASFQRFPSYQGSFRATFTSLEANSKKADETSVERPDPSILLSARDDATQRLGFVAICGSLALGSILMVLLLNTLETSLPDGWFAAWRDYTWPIPLGLIFAAAGVTHFAFAESYIAFVPPRDTWGGLWQVPAPGATQLNLSYEEYHCYWTGVAEVLGGVALVLSGLHLIPLPVQVPALCLGALTAAVTPANIYMATHDIQPPNFPPVPYPSGHIVRGVMQCVLLGVFWKLAFQ